MEVANQDYYDVLGVPRDADRETIRRAFLEEARKCHPDVSDAPEDGLRFRILSHAYQVLSEPESRQLYDRYGYRGRGSPAQPAGEGHGERGGSVVTEIDLRDYEAWQGTARVVEYLAADACAECGGRGLAGDPDPGCPECGGTGRKGEVSDVAGSRMVRFEPCSMCETEICPRCGGNGREVTPRRLRVRIPAGIQDGAQLRVAGEGDAGEWGGPPGDLLLDVHLLPPPRDSRQIRYLAAALCVAAVVLLVAYLLLR